MMDSISVSVGVNVPSRSTTSGGRPVAEVMGVNSVMIFGYSTLIPRIAITPPSMLVSLLMRLASPSGEVPTTCQPCWNSLVRTSGERAISLNAVDSLATMGWGSDLGAAIAF